MRMSSSGNYLFSSRATTALHHATSRPWGMFQVLCTSSTSIQSVASHFGFPKPIHCLYELS